MFLSVKLLCGHETRVVFRELQGSRFDWSGNWVTEQSSLSNERFSHSSHNVARLKFRLCAWSFVSYDSRIWTNQKARIARDWKIAWCLEKSMEKFKKNVGKGFVENRSTTWQTSFTFVRCPIKHWWFSCLNVSYATRQQLVCFVSGWVEIFIFYLISERFREKKIMWRPFQATTKASSSSKRARAGWLKWRVDFQWNSNPAR